MTGQTTLRKGNPIFNRGQVVRVLVSAAVWGATWILYNAVSNKYQDWSSRREYDRRYSKLLPLPNDISRPSAKLQRLPGVVGKGLCIDFNWPNSSDDKRLLAWFTKHEGFSTFESDYPHLFPPYGQWRATRGKQILVVCRIDDDKVGVTLAEPMSPVDAGRDLATFPWRQRASTE
jgi:hypothetical protein